jgi:hypothetical protein
MCRFTLLLCVAALASCATQTGWVRADGKPITEKQLQGASTVCHEKAGSYVGDSNRKAFESCMSERGYRQQAAN